MRVGYAHIRQGHIARIGNSVGIGDDIANIRTRSLVGCLDQCRGWRRIFDRDSF